MAGPVVAGHRARRAVDDAGVMQVRPLVRGGDRVDADAEIPRGDDALGELRGGAAAAALVQAGLCAELHGLDLEPRQRPVADAGAVDLAVVVTGDHDSLRHRGRGLHAAGTVTDKAGDDARDAAVLDLLLDGGRHRRDLGIERIGDLGLVIQDRLAGLRIEGGREKMPGVIAQRRAGGQLDAIHAQLGTAGLVDEQPVAAFGRGPLRDQSLRAVLPVLRVRLRRRRPDPALEREAVELETDVVEHIAIRAAVNDLLAPGVFGVHRDADRLLDEARPARIGVTVDHLDDLGLVLLRAVAVHEELDLVP